MVEVIVAALRAYFFRLPTLVLAACIVGVQYASALCCRNFNNRCCRWVVRHSLSAQGHSKEPMSWAAQKGRLCNKASFPCSCMLLSFYEVQRHRSRCDCKCLKICRCVRWSCDVVVTVYVRKAQWYGGFIGPREVARTCGSVWTVSDVCFVAVTPCSLVTVLQILSTPYHRNEDSNRYLLEAYKLSLAFNGRRCSI